MLRVEDLRTIEELNSVSGQWDRLLEQSLTPCHAMSWDWISNWLNVYLQNRAILCLAVYDDDRLVGLAPFWVEKKRSFLLFGVRILKLIGSEEVCGDHTDLIVHRKNSVAICGAIWERLFGELGGEWDIWEYNSIPSNSKVLQAFRKKSETDKRCLELALWGYIICPYIELPSTWDEYLASLSVNQRRAFKVSSESMSQAGEVQLRLCENSQDLASFMQTHIELHRKSWIDRGHQGAFETKSFREFHMKYALSLLSTGQLFLCNLELNGTPVASLYGFVYGRVLYYYLLGVDRSAVPKASIGRVLMGRCIEEAIRRGYSRFDFLRGFEEYKYDWTDLEQRELLSSFYNRSIGAVAFILRQFISKFGRQVINVILGDKTATVKRMLGGKTRKQVTA